MLLNTNTMHRMKCSRRSWHVIRSRLCVWGKKKLVVTIKAETGEVVLAVLTGK